MVLSGLFFLHFLLIQEFVKQNKAQKSRIKAMQKQVDIEVSRTMGLNSKNHQLDRLSKKSGLHMAPKNLAPDLKSE